MASALPDHYGPLSALTVVTFKPESVLLLSSCTSNPALLTMLSRLHARSTATGSAWLTSTVLYDL